MDGSHVRIGSCILAGDMDIMVRFYRDTLGFQTQWDGGDFAEFETAGANYPFGCTAGRNLLRQSGRTIFRLRESIRHLKSPFGYQVLLMWMRNMSGCQS